MLVLEKGHVDARSTVLACVEAQIEEGPTHLSSARPDGEVAERMGQVHFFVEDIGSGGQRGIIVVLQAILRPPLKLFLVIVAHDRMDGYLRFGDFEPARIRAIFLKGKVSIGWHAAVIGALQWEAV